MEPAAAFCPFIHCADDDPRPRPWRSGTRLLTHWLFVTSRAGDEQITVDGAGIRVPAGASYVVQPGRRAQLGSARGSTPVWIHADLAFHPRRHEHPQVHAHCPDLGPRGRWLQPDAQALFGIDLPVLVPSALAAAFRAGIPAAVARWKQGDALAGLEAAQQLGGLVLALVAHLRGTAPADPETRLARAEAVARAQLASGITAADMAVAAGMSRSRFFALYRRLRGRPPAAFLRETRRRLAEELLARGDLPVARVGELVGHPDPTVFGRIFRAAHGTTPSAWRARRG